MVWSVRSRALPRLLAIVVTIVLAVFLTPVIAISAADAAGQTIGNFEIDGNTTHEAVTDWNDLSAAQVFTALDNTSQSGQDASTFQSSSHEYSGGGTWPGWTYGGGNATGKADFGRFAVYTKTAQVGGDDHQFLYFAFDRGFGQGTGDYAFEFNQLQQNLANDPNPRRSQGDIRIILDDQGNGNITLDQDMGGLYVWDDPDQGAGAVGEDTDQDGDWVRMSSGDYFATSNATTPLTDLPSWWTSQNASGGTIGNNQFIEAGLDLTDFGAALGCPSEGFTAANARSITGTGAGALVDYIPFVPIAIPSTCSSIPIEKHVQNADGSEGALLGGATFTISPDPRPGQNGASLDVTDNGANDSDSANGKILISPAKPGDYTIVEKTAPAGYVKDGDTENVTAPKSAPAPVTTFLNGLGKVAWHKVDAKTGDPLAGATFQIKATGGAAAAAPWSLDSNPISVTDNAGRDTDPANGEFKVVGLPTGTYQLKETAAPTGYEVDPAVTSFTISTTSTVKPAYATFSDPRVKSRLTVEKRDAKTDEVLAGAQFSLFQDDNGTAGLQQSGPNADSVAGSCVTGVDGRCSVPDAAVPASLEWGYDYYWVETAPPVGYNLPTQTVQGPIAITKANAGTSFPVTVFNDPKSKITTTATNGTLPGASITDTAKLSGVPDNAQGSITFKAYGPVTGPNPQPTCTTLAFTSSPVAVSGAGDYGPVTFHPTEAGTYYWIATYTGDPAHQVLGVSGECGDANETSTVTPAKPGITTVATPTSKLPNAGISDTAKVTPVTGNATGTVSFALYGPNDATCAGPAAATYSGVAITVTSDGQGGFFATASSPTYTATKAGTYRWIASYTGDANNEGVSGTCNDANETSVVEKATPAISTLATAQNSLPNGTISDTATVTGLTPDATGTVAFSLYGPNDAACSGQSLVSDSHTFTVVNGKAIVTSDAFTPVLAGTYRWIASYSGDSNNEGVSGTCNDAGETSTVDKASPAISTQATPTAMLPGATLHDTANLTGLSATAGGTVTFNLYGPADQTCSQQAVFTSAKALVNNGDGTGTATSADYVATAAGTYHWIASYGGDADNKPVSGSCGDPNETSVVEKATPSISTSATPTATLPGGSIHDVATVSGLTADATGTVSFALYGASDPTCEDDAVFTDSKAIQVAGGVGTATSGSYFPSDSGDYHWIASYSGDANNAPAAGTCGDQGETSVVGKAPTDISTSATASAGLPSGTISDTATVTGITPNATGTVTFSLYGPSDPTCGDDAVFTSTKALLVDGSTGTAASDSYKPTHAGSYHWIAAYSGDGNNAPSAGACGDEGETSVVDKTWPAISTLATPNVVLPVGGITDTATVTGLTSSATGTVRFDLYGPSDDCSGPVIFTSTVAIQVNGSTGTASTTTFQPTLAGQYHWIAAYSGDADNNPVAGACNDANENSTVDRAQPSISTQATGEAQLPDATISDTASLTGLTANATGSVAFSLYGPSDPTCADDAVFTSTNALVNNGDGTGTATSGSYVATAAGTYHWIASYGGDANNKPVAGQCGDEGETSVVTKADPSIATNATALAVIDDGDTVSDVATISGATSDATGTVTFNVYGPNDATCTTDSVFTSVRPITKNGAVFNATSEAFTPTEPGTYRWIAAYSGDANNKAVSGACGDQGETSVVKQGDKPTLLKGADPASGTVVKPGTTVTYTVTAGNSGDVAIEDGVVTDILPAHVTLVPGTISNGGVLAGGTITWTLDFGPAGSQEPPSQYALTYKVKVDDDTPAGSTLLNQAKFFDLTASTTHRTPTGTLTIVKTNDPTGTVAEGDTIGYAMAVKVSDDANTNQDGVVVTDYVPGYDPARTDSATTTYVDGSAKCTGTILPAGGTCDVSLVKNSDGKVTAIRWALGSMAPGQVTNTVFSVTVDKLPAGVTEGTVLNAALVQSESTPPTPSNQVSNPVQGVAVLGVKQPAAEKPGGVLAATGLLFRLDHAVELSGLLLLLGGFALVLARRTKARSNG